MTSRPASELLYDSEAALRLIDTALDEIQGPDARPRRPSAPRPATLHLALRQSSPAEGAELLDGLDRVLALMDELDASDDDDLRRELRDRLSQLATRLDAED